MADKDAFLLKLAQLHFKDGLDFGKIVASHREELRDLYGIDVHLKNVGALMQEAGQYLLREKERLSHVEAFQRGDIQLSRRLVQKFPHLRWVHIATLPEPLRQGDAIRLKFWPESAAAFLDTALDSLITEGVIPHIAVSGGEIIMDVLGALPQRRRNWHFYPAAAIGRGRLNDAGIPGPDTNATIAWSRSGRQPATLHLVTAPPFDAVPEIAGESIEKRHGRATRLLQEQRAQILDDNHELREGLRNIRDKVNIVISSLGTNALPVEPALSADISPLKMTPPFLQPYGVNMDVPDMANALGDIAHIFFDAAGEDRPEWRLLFTPGAGTKQDGIEFVKHVMKKENGLVIVVAIGLNAVMIPVILAAIYARLFNVLVTDRETAETLLGM